MHFQLYQCLSWIVNELHVSKFSFDDVGVKFATTNLFKTKYIGEHFDFTLVRNSLSILSLSLVAYKQVDRFIKRPVEKNKNNFQITKVAILGTSFYVTMFHLSSLVVWLFFLSTM